MLQTKDDLKQKGQAKKSPNPIFCTHANGDGRLFRSPQNLFVRGQKG